MRVIIERLLRKHGAEAIGAVFPPQHVKLLSNITKSASRRARKAKGMGAAEEKDGEKSAFDAMVEGGADEADLYGLSDDDEGDMMFDGEGGSSALSRLVDDPELDLMDSSMVKSCVNPPCYSCVLITDSSFSLSLSLITLQRRGGQAFAQALAR